MSQPARPVPGPPRPGPTAPPSSAAEAGPVDGPALAEQVRGLPVTEHPGVLAAEHDRLQRQLATIDQL